MIRPPQKIVITNASNLGWGAWMNNQEAQGFWSLMKIKYNNNVRELLTGFYGLQSFKVDLLEEL